MIDTDHEGRAYIWALRDELVREFARECGPLSRDAEIILTRSFDRYGDVVADIVGRLRMWEQLTQY